VIVTAAAAKAMATMLASPIAQPPPPDLGALLAAGGWMTCADGDAAGEACALGWLAAG
jgi:hypothetical protein